MLGHIYTIHNIKNNKIYVGQTVNISRRWRDHISLALCDRAQDKQYIHKAIGKWGIDNFVFSIHQSIEGNQKDLDVAEIYWIEYFQSNLYKYPNGKGYNLAPGGDMNCGGAKLTEIEVIEIRKLYNSFSDKKISLVELGEKYNISAGGIAHIIYNRTWYDPNYIPPKQRKINNNGLPKLTSEIANDIRLLFIGGSSYRELAEKYQVSPENISCILHNKTWKISDEEIIKKLKAITDITKLKSLDPFGENNPFYGKKHSLQVINSFSGENSKVSKLKESQVIEIRSKYKTNNYTQKQLAKEYQVDVRSIGHIIRNNTWKHLLEKVKE